MSYDLYFTRPTLTLDQFTSYFRARRHYEVSGHQCTYQNADTGVYFGFDYHDANEADEDALRCTASLRVNYCRPHVFGLEAVAEVADWVAHFGLSIHDPQSQGMGDGPFSEEGFLRGWNHGNEVGYSFILGGDHATQAVWTLPRERLEAIWKWNRDKRMVQDSCREDRFVPRVVFMNVAGKLASVAVWPDAMCELVPEVDYLFIRRDELAPKPFFRPRKPDQFLLPFDQVKPALDPYAAASHPLPAYELPAPNVPTALQRFVRTLSPTGIMGALVPTDQVLNEEIVAKFRKA